MSGPIRHFEPTMSSLDIVDIINEERKAEAAGAPFKTIRHDTFIIKVEKHPGITHQNFLASYKDSMNRKQTEYLLDRELTDTLLTGYSAVRRRLETASRNASVNLPTWSAV